MAVGLAGPHGPEEQWGLPAEAARLAAVRRYDILDTPPEDAFDRAAALAARVFDVPMATVSVVDEDRIWFKATYGLDGVTQIDREPGLCASAVLEDGPYVVPDTLADPTARKNSLVTGEMGVRFYAGAPIVTTDGRRVGTVNVLDTRPREVDEAALATLQDLAAMMADQLDLRLSALTTFRRERRLRKQAESERASLASFASTMQRTLLPPTLPEVPGLELASHYHPASPRQVGGDFYDVFTLDDGRWAFMLGDVCGKGATAAALTSFVRYTLRTLANHHTDPTDMLGELNRALLAEQDPQERPRFCTAMFGLLEPEPGFGNGDGAGTRVTLTSGGHPPAYQLRPDATVESLEMPGGMLIGALECAEFASRSTRLAPGDALLLYTDGLTEARTPDGELFEEDGLRKFLGECTGLGAADLVKQTSGLLDSFDSGHRDDVALLALAVPDLADQPSR